MVRLSMSEISLDLCCVASYDFIQTYLVNIFKFCCKVSIYSSLHSDVLMVLLIIRVIFDK